MTALSIRARILGPLAVLVLVAFAVIGVSAVTVTRDGMMDRLDDSLRDSQDRAIEAQAEVGEFAVIIISPDGQIDDVVASGTASEPLALPAIDRLIDARPAPRSDRFLDVEAGDGSGQRYRALLRTSANGRTAVHAAPLDEVDDVIRQLQRVLMTVGATALVLLMVLTWTLVRSGLRPIEDMIDTASDIAAGDYSRRVDYTQPETEVGRLGAAINSMLGRIESAFGSERRSQEQLRRFVADASHELRTPLTSIQGYAQLYRSGAVDDDEGRERAMERIEAAGTRMADLVEELLLLTHLDHGIVEQRDDVDLVEIVRELISDRRIVEPRRPLVHSGADAAWVRGDRRQLMQVVGNLLDNACGHTPEDALVVVAVAEDHGIVEMNVIDHGDGLAAADLGLIFDRFHRTEQSRARHSGGSGLGLAIVKAIVDAHDGSVSVESPPNQGATFRVRLPAAGVPGVVHDAPPTRSAQADSLPES